MTLNEFILQQVEVGTEEARDKIWRALLALAFYCTHRCRGVYAINKDGIEICRKHMDKIFNIDMEEVFHEDYFRYIGL